MSEHDVSFEAMGSHVRLLIGEPRPGNLPAAVAAERAKAFIVGFESELSRFRSDSELSLLNCDARERVPCSPLLRQAVAAGVEAAERTGGLVDPTLFSEIENAGYVASLAGVPGASLREALAAAPARRPSSPSPARRWRGFTVDDQAGEVVRAPGLRFDSGGIGKGLAADLLAAELAGYSRFVVDCGGDIRIGGVDALLRPYEVFVEHPLSRERTHVLRLGSGGVATSGLNVRVWRRESGFAHHLIDPGSGEPAWTGLIGATALADSALEAETLSKAALLSGPRLGRDLLSEHGGLLVHDNGEVETVGPLAIAPRIPVTPDRESALA